MGRPRSFDTETFLQQACALFVDRGFAATSIDELVKATGVVRGSLYSIFGSKQGIFAAALENAVSHYGGQDDQTMLLDLVNVAVYEVASHNSEISRLVQRVIDTHGISAAMLGQRALERAGLNGPNR